MLSDTEDFVSVWGVINVLCNVMAYYLTCVRLVGFIISLNAGMLFIYFCIFILVNFG